MTVEQESNEAFDGKMRILREMIVQKRYEFAIENLERYRDYALRWGKFGDGHWDKVMNIWHSVNRTRLGRARR